MEGLTEALPRHMASFPALVKVGVLAGAFALGGHGIALAAGGAVTLPNGETQFFNGNGVPLAGGSVQTYVPGTTSSKPTWIDPNLTTTNPNPVLLNSSGMALIFGQGNYREIVEDSSSNVVWDQVVNTPGGMVDVQNGLYMWGGNATGGSGAMSIVVSPPLSAYSSGQTFRFITNQTAAGGSSFPTLTVNSVGAVNITNPLLGIPSSGSWASGTVLQVTYDGTEFQVLPLVGQTISGTSIPSNGTSTGQVATWGGTSSGWIALALRNFMTGVNLINDTTTTNNVIDVGSGVAADSNNLAMISFPSVFTKSTSGSWSSGSGQNGMGSGLTVTTSTWYVVCAIINSGTPDVEIDTSAACSNAPAGTTAVRRLGSIHTDSASHIQTFFQNGDYFRWVNPSLDVNGTFFNSNYTSVTLMVPSGVSVVALGTVGSVQGSEVNIRPVGATDPTPAQGLGFTGGTGAGADAVEGMFQVLTNSAAQAQIGTGAAGTGQAVTAYTHGWLDFRGRD